MPVVFSVIHGARRARTRTTKKYKEAMAMKRIMAGFGKEGEAEMMLDMKSRSVQ